MKNLSLIAFLFLILFSACEDPEELIVDPPLENTFYGCHINEEYVKISAKFVFDDDTLLANDGAMVTVFNENFSYAASGNPDEFGRICGCVPPNETLFIRVVDFSCDTPIFEEEVGSFSEDTDLGLFTLETVNVSTTTIAGTLVDCDDNPISNGFLKLIYPNATRYHLISSSNFSYIEESCFPPNSISVVSVDLDNNVEGQPINITVGAENNLDIVTACGTASTPDFLNLTVDGETKNYLVTQVLRFENDSIRFEVEGIESANMKISFAGVTSGSYENPDNLAFIHDWEAGWYFSSYTSTGGEGFSEFEVQEINDRLSGIISNESDDVQGEFLITPPE